MGIETQKHVYDRCEPEGVCMIWTQNVNSTGYPMASIAGKPTLVSRWILQQRLGRPIRKGYCAATSCGNRRCVACVVERSLSAVVTMMHRTGKRSTPAAKLAIQQSALKTGRLRLDMRKAREIRALRGLVSAKVLGERYGCSSRAIEDVWSGKSWKEFGVASSVFSLGLAA